MRNKSSRAGAPFKYDEGDVQHLCDLVKEMRDAAKLGEGCSLVSPMSEIERQIRYQLNRFKVDLPCEPDSLKTPHDFTERPTSISRIEAAFLLDFLKLVLELGFWPALITDANVVQFRQSLRSFYMLTESQRTGGETLPEEPFKRFAFDVWLNIPNRAQASGRQWWDRALKKISEDDVTFDMYTPRKSKLGLGVGDN